MGFSQAWQYSRVDRRKGDSETWTVSVLQGQKLGREREPAAAGNFSSAHIAGRVWLEKAEQAAEKEGERSKHSSGALEVEHPQKSGTPSQESVSTGDISDSDPGIWIGKAKGGSCSEMGTRPGC